MCLSPYGRQLCLGGRREDGNLVTAAVVVVVDVLESHSLLLFPSWWCDSCREWPLFPGRTCVREPSEGMKQLLHRAR